MLERQDSFGFKPFPSPYKVRGLIQGGTFQCLSFLTSKTGIAVLVL